MLKPKRLILTTVFASAGAAYFVAFSQLDLSIFLRGYVAIVPLQVLTLLYVLYQQWNRRSTEPIEPEHQQPDF
jgi:hypothetical protein